MSRGAPAWPKRRTYGLIVLGTVAPRLLFAFLRPPDPSWGAYYWPMSSNLLRDGVLGYDRGPSTLYEPLYPLFLAAARAATGDHLFSVLALQALVGAVGAVYLYELTLSLARDQRTAAIAAGIYAVYPYYVRQSAALEEVSLFTTLLIAAAYYQVTAETAARSLACGFVFGLALLTRMIAAPLVLLGVAVLAGRRRFASALAVGGVAALLYAPYAWRNHRIDGSILPTRSGYNLFKSNCEYSDRVIPEFMVDVLNPYVARVAEQGLAGRPGATEREIDRFYSSRAIAFIRAHPVGAILRWGRNALVLFMPRLVPFHPIGPATTSRFTATGDLVVERPLDRSPIDEWAYTASYAPLLAAALVGMFLRRSEIGRDLVLLLAVLCFAVVYSVFWPATRVRSPVDFVLMFYAACALRRAVPGPGRVPGRHTEIPVPSVNCFMQK